jgi:cobalt-zinc-cadmium efflux system membrane fusion protein
MMRVIALALCAVAAAGCHAADQTPPQRSADSPAAPPVRGRVHLSDAQLAKVHIEELSTHAPADVIKATGTVEFNGDRMAKLLAPAVGQVQRLAVNVGDTVRKNDVLFMLSSRDVAAAIADHETSMKDLELAERTQAMTQDLFDHQAASRIALEQSRNELAKARARLQQTENNLTVLGINPATVDGDTTHSSTVPVRAPIAGTVIDRAVTDGQFVGNDATPLITIADLSSVWVQADVFERDLRNIAVNQQADLTTAAYPADRFVAHVSRIASVVDPQTRTAKVRFIVANAGERLKPGMFASIDLHLPEPGSALTVSAKAAFVENGQSFVYLQVGAGDFARRGVETTPSGADRLRVVRGLAAGDRVVTDGVLLLRQLEADASQ